MKTRVMFLSILVLTLAAATFGQRGELDSRRWKLVELNSRPTPDTIAYIEFRSNESRFTGNAGCNRMFGSVGIRNRRIAFSKIGTTRMACPGNRVSRQEADFLYALRRATRYQVAGNDLSIYRNNRVIIRLYGGGKQAPEEPGEPVKIRLEDRKWMLSEIKGNPVSKAGRSAFIVFDEAKKSAGGNSSCNSFGGSYSVTNSTLAITEIISTMRACIEDDRMTIERDFLDGLRTANRYEIENERLMLYRNKRLLLTFDGVNK